MCQETRGNITVESLNCEMRGWHLHCHHGNRVICLLPVSSKTMLIPPQKIRCLLSKTKKHCHQTASCVARKLGDFAIWEPLEQTFTPPDKKTKNKKQMVYEPLCISKRSIHEKTLRCTIQVQVKTPQVPWLGPKQTDHKIYLFSCVFIVFLLLFLQHTTKLS